MKIESTDQDIRMLLSAGYYAIPRFQRPYSWEKDNIQEFWNDVIVRDNPSDYFIGPMVVYKDGQQKYGIVDGQQRLTTITILLCVLRNNLDNLGFNDLAAGIHGLVERANIDNKKQFILSTESSYPFFQDYIQKWGKPEVPVTPLREEKNLEAAYRILNELVEQALQNINKDSTLTDKKFHFCFTAVTSQRSSGGISAMYARLGRELHSSKDTQAAVSVIKDLKNKLKNKMPSYDEFQALFTEILYTDNVTRQRRLAKYILVGLSQATPSAITLD